MKGKMKVAVIMGGVSSEHEVSLMSGKEIVKNLDAKKYNVSSVVISKEGKDLEKIIKIKPDIALIALHGKYGEDGKIQGYLESTGIKYTGSGVLASAIGMDKIIFRKLMENLSLHVPAYTILRKGEKFLKPNFKFPYFVKPYDGGSSVGVSFVKNSKELSKAIKTAFKYSDKILIERYIKGLEINCGVLGNKKPIALPLIEIHPLFGKFFDYKSKYITNGSNEIVPAKISKTLTNEIQEISLKIYKSIGCRGYARIDYILEDNTKPVILEINTLPGMTANSLLPKEAKAAGITYSQLLDMIVTYALNEN